MQRTPKSGHSAMFSSQPNLSTENDLNDVVRNINLRKRKNPDLDLVMDLKDSLMQSFKDMLNAEVSEMKQQNVQILQSNAEIIQLLQANAADLKQANEKIAVLESGHAAALERVNDLEYQLHEVQKQQKKKMVEIRNLPRDDKENIKEICDTLYNTLNIQPAAGIAQMYRKGKNSNSPIVIEFHDENQKENLLTAVKKFNKSENSSKLSSEHLGVKGDRTKVYVSEAITTMTKKIYGEARDLVKNGQYRYCWISRGNVLLRRDEGQPAVLIKSLHQIAALRSL